VSHPKLNRILFVDDEPPVLTLLQNLLRLANPLWQCAFAASGTQALQLIQAQPFDVVVSDMRMPEMSGLQLLTQVRDNWPRTARLILTGYTDVELGIQSLGVVHQFLAKPFTLTSLQSVLNQILNTSPYVPVPSLQNALGRIHSLPTGPSVCELFVRDLASPVVSVDTLGGHAAQDVALTAKLLQLARSAFFGSAHNALTAKACVQSLGPSLLRKIAASHHFLLKPPQPHIGGLSIESLSHHATATGLHASRILAQESASPNTARTAFTAGVLHTIGRLALAHAQPDQYTVVTRQVTAGKAPLLQAERDTFGVTSPRAGAYLLALWGIPHEIVDIVAHAADPSRSNHQNIGPLAAIHVASHLHRAQTGLPEEAAPPLDLPWLESIGVDSTRINTWIQAGQPD
jgi:HD-like signal output (HDOD) protein/CheY-like chemotaxis protein